MDQSVTDREDKRFAAPLEFEIHRAIPEAAFDGIVDVATRLLKAPVAALHVVGGDGPWIRPTNGLPAGVDAIVAELIGHEGLMVGDIHADPQFAHLSADPAFAHICAFAGVALQTADGQRIGILCVFDEQPRDWSEDDLLCLQMLARQATTELELWNMRLSKGLIRDERDRLVAEKDDLLARNDVLMREVDHRVKNSLQLVSSMLRIQARQMPKSEAADILEEAQRRIAGIAAVHEQLYQASSIDQVDLAAFINGLCASLAANRPENITAVRVTADPLMLGSRRAMKVGLVLIELVVNCFKHAYGEEQQGDIHVSVSDGGDAVRLVIEDDGIGLPDAFSIEASRGLGMRLIRSVLSEFSGTMEAQSAGGARFVIDIPRG